MAPAHPAISDEFCPPDISGLVIEDDAPVDNIFSEKQERLLTEPLYTSWTGPPHEQNQPPRPFAVLANVGLFPALRESPIVPDVMLVVDVKLNDDYSKKENRTYLMWVVGKCPDIVIEVVSNREGGELSEKMHRYRRIGIRFYVVFDPYHHLSSTSLRVYELRGDLYIALERFWFESIGLGLVEWEGEFERSREKWLRWCSKDGRLIPTGAEQVAVIARQATKEAQRATKEAQRATKEAQRASAEAERASKEADRAERLAARLRELGIDPDSV
jgi:Uma2 family endonuclease